VAALQDENAALQASLASANATPIQTLQRSAFICAYGAATRPAYPDELLGAVRNMILCYCAANRLDNAAGIALFEGLQKDAFAHSSELLSAVASAAERAWTSARKLQNVPTRHEIEFCSMLNALIRDDDADSMRLVSPVCRAINHLLCAARGSAWSAGGGADALEFPPLRNGRRECYRGGGFDPAAQPFFLAGKKYRVPGFLATSFQERVAKEFIERSHMPARVLWIIRLKPDCETNPANRCKHVNLVKSTEVAGEHEYLFAPYSVFTVLGAEWRAGTASEPHIITLEAAVDNACESQALPLAPWN
jgi:hypothetical protein